MPTIGWIIIIWIGSFLTLPFWPDDLKDAGAWIIIYIPLLLLLAGMLIAIPLTAGNNCGLPGRYC